MIPVAGKSHATSRAGVHYGLIRRLRTPAEALVRSLAVSEIVESSADARFQTGVAPADCGSPAFLAEAREPQVSAAVVRVFRVSEDDECISAESARVVVEVHGGKLMPPQAQSVYPAVEMRGPLVARVADAYLELLRSTTWGGI